MITAKEAREITNARTKTTKEIIKIIEAMAHSGNDFATARTKELKDAEKTEKELIELGFIVKKDDTYFNINW